MTDFDLPQNPPANFELRVYNKFKGELSAVERKYFEGNNLPGLRQKPDTGSFAYSDTEKSADEQRLTEKQKTAQGDPNYLRAKIMEHFLAQVVELEDWLGPDTFTTEVSDFDDWFHGVDSGIEFNGSEPIRLAVDFTFDSSAEKLSRKLEPIFREIEDGNLAQVKYFVSQVDSQPRQLQHLPKLVIALEPKTLNDLLSKSKEELANHWARLAILFELQSQLSFFIKYSKNTNRPGYDAAKSLEIEKAYLPVLDKIRGLIETALADVRSRFPKNTAPPDEAQFRAMLVQGLARRDRAFGALVGVIQ